MDLIEKITKIIEPSLVDMGYTLVLVKLSDNDRRKTLTVMAERKDDVMMSFDDCTDISRQVGALLEVEDPITTAYDLEISSPGVDRPMTRLEDYTRFIGKEVKVESQLPIAGRRRFKGKIAQTEGQNVVITMPDIPEGRAVIPFKNIRTAKLVMTDDLLAEHMRKQKKPVMKKKGTL